MVPERRSGPVEVRYTVRLTPGLVWAIVAPYFRDRLVEQLKGLAPISLFLFVCQLVVLRQPVLGAASVTLGLSCVVLGLMFFIEGLKVGVMPLGENIGATLPAKAGLRIILTAAFLLGTIATFAEPAIATLTVLGGNVRYEGAPLLFDFLNERAALLLLLAAAGVGLGAINGMVRFLRKWSLKFTIMPGLVLAVGLTVLAAIDPVARDLVGVAWDTGGITTGTVTAPLVLALGVGMARALGNSDTGMSGFGIITLCSIWPIVLVLIVALGVSWTGTYMTPAAYASMQASGAAAAAEGTGGTNTLAMIGQSFLSAGISILPLIGLLLIIQRVLLREPVRNLDYVVVGVLFALLGLAAFKIGLVYGLTPLGEQVGSSATLAFAPEGGLYGDLWGKVVVLAFAFLAGYGASLAEPALISLGMTVEEVTAGAFKKFLVMHAVAFGVGLGLIVGVARILFGWSSLAIVLPSYVIVLLLTAVSEEKYVNIGWDSGGVTTGDITSPILIALGLGVAAAAGGADGFSLIAMGSVWPIIAVLALGLFVNKTTPAARAAA
jgi:hypothetical protein